MRMRRKKGLEERLLACGDILAAREGYDFYEREPDLRKSVCDFDILFKNSHPKALEIGCGKGGFIIETARRTPNVNFVAMEKLSNVIVSACEDAKKAHLLNLLFVNCAAENSECFLPESSFETLYLNFSCPYQKKSYANRRLTNEKYLEIYRRLLTKDGKIIQKTDDNDFFTYSIDCYRENGFEIIKMSRDLYSEPYAEKNVATEYERRFASQHLPINYVEVTVRR